MTKYKHNDGKILNSFEEAVNYWRENYFDGEFDEVDDNETEDDDDSS